MFCKSVGFVNFLLTQPPGIADDSPVRAMKLTDLSKEWGLCEKSTSRSRFIVRSRFNSTWKFTPLFEFTR